MPQHERRTHTTNRHHSMQTQASGVLGATQRPEQADTTAPPTLSATQRGPVPRCAPPRAPPPLPPAGMYHKPASCAQTAAKCTPQHPQNAPVPNFGGGRRLPPQPVTASRRCVHPFLHSLCAADFHNVLKVVFQAQQDVPRTRSGGVDGVLAAFPPLCTRVSWPRQPHGSRTHG